MNILVCISCVPDTTSKINFTQNKKKLDEGGITFIINPYDEFCLTKAIIMKESSGANVTVISVGDSKSEPVLRKALAIGADSAVRINANSDSSKSVANLIANYCSKNKFDIIFCGRESIDFNGGQVPGFIAAKLNLPFINSCVGLDYIDDKINAKREIDNGHEICECSLPAVVAGQKGLVEEKDLKIPSMRGIMTARTKPLEVLDSESTYNNNIEILELSKPSERSDCKIISEDNVGELVQLLHKEAKVI